MSYEIEPENKPYLFNMGINSKTPAATHNFFHKNLLITYTLKNAETLYFTRGFVIFVCWRKFEKQPNL